MSENIFPKIKREKLPVIFSNLHEKPHQKEALSNYNVVSVEFYDTTSFPVESFYKPISKMLNALPFQE